MEVPMTFSFPIPDSVQGFSFLFSFTFPQSTNTSLSSYCDENTSHFFTIIIAREFEVTYGCRIGLDLARLRYLTAMYSLDLRHKAAGPWTSKVLTEVNWSFDCLRAAASGPKSSIINIF
ncbi:hypothetical protein MG293_010718 [Ovis ammon polii]|uniref:Uncharacterized protein n=1 Tax=Ovis ammon polii TaxID=230172 RepID=A0AAD4U6B5_OVIAM|nr:hypothetical protein MG293_010718 [Ovis ammon polii]